VKERTDKELPKWTASKIEKEDPARAWPKMETLEPSRAKDLTEKELPRFTKSK
jgi:hypothetical protein